MGASGYRDHIIVCGWNSTARELIQELSTDEYTTKIVVIHDSDKNPAGEGVYFVSGDITTAARPQAGRHRGRPGRGGVPRGRLQRGRHEVDPLRDGDRVDRPAGADRRRGQQPLARRALPARRRRRDPGLLAAGLPAHGPLVALPGARRPGHRHRLRRRGLRALPGPAARRLRGPVGRRALGQAPRRAPRHAALRQPLAASPTSTRPTTSGSPRATTWSWSPSRSARWPRWRWTTTSAASSRPEAQPGRTPAITTSSPPFQVTASVSAASTYVPTTRATTSSSGAGVDDRQRPLVVAADGVDARHVRVGAPACPAPGRWSGRSRGRCRRRTRGSTPVPPVRIAAASSPTNTGSAQPS